VRRWIVVGHPKAFALLDFWAILSPYNRKFLTSLSSVVKELEA